MKRQKRELRAHIPNEWVNYLEMAMFTRDTGRCMKCGSAVVFEADEDGNTDATCPGCGQFLGWSPDFF